MLFLLRLLFGSLVLLTLTLSLILLLSTSNTGAINQPVWLLTSADLERAKSILHSNQQAKNQLIRLRLTERDLNIAATYLLNLYADNHTNIKLKTESIHFSIYLKLPKNLFGSYLNIQFQLYAPPFRMPKIQNLHIGQLHIPNIYAGLLIEKIIQHTRLKQYLALISQNLKTFELLPQQLNISYQLPANAFNKIQKLLTPSIDKRALAQYQKILHQAIQQHDPAWRLSLSEILQPLFKLALQRSTASNAITENQLVLFIANRYVNHSSSLLTTSFTTQPVPYYPVYLYRRIDMAQHFMWSAALSASSNSQLAHVIGLGKELHDADHGSGFSFIDLAADRAGMTLGKYATASPEQAMKLQQKMASVNSYHAFVPNFLDLPENLNTETFKTRYESIYSPQYQRTLQNIDQRIAHCPIYQ